MKGNNMYCNFITILNKAYNITDIKSAAIILHAMHFQILSNSTLRYWHSIVVLKWDTGRHNNRLNNSYENVNSCENTHKTLYY